MKNYQKILDDLQQSGSLRTLPEILHHEKIIEKDGRKMLNLSSNDYLGLASDKKIYAEFLQKISNEVIPFSSSSSRLLTGNFSQYSELETIIAESFKREASLIFNSGYHANTGILPALADNESLIVADKLVHASIIDGILLSKANFLRYKHNDYLHLEKILDQNYHKYKQIFVVTESVFSMDGDIADLPLLVSFKKKYPNILLYVDEAHAIGVRGENGLGLAEEKNCLQDIDFIVGTFGKALASMGAYLICSKSIKKYLTNFSRSLIFSTALPPIQIAWTAFIWQKLPKLQNQREHLAKISELLKSALIGKGGEISQSNVIPYIIGENCDCVNFAKNLQENGFYCLPIRPPTVPQGTSRIRFSLTANLTFSEIENLIKFLPKHNN